MKRRVAFLNCNTPRIGFRSPRYDLNAPNTSLILFTKGQNENQIAIGLCLFLVFIFQALICGVDIIEGHKRGGRNHAIYNTLSNFLFLVLLF